MYTAATIRKIARTSSRSYIFGSIDFSQLTKIDGFTPDQACYYLLCIASFLPDSVEIELRREFAIRIDKLFVKLTSTKNETIQTVVS